MAVANNMIASLLTPVENFQQRRQDRINEANFTSQITRQQLFQEEKVRQERTFAEQQLAQLRSLNVEDEDRMKIDQFLSTFQEGVEKKIKKNYKSPMEYIRTEFNRDISLLKEALVSSDVYKNAIHNKTVMNAVRNDIKEGLVSMGQIGQTPDGRVSINSIESQLSEWRQGKRDRLEYMGSYKAPTKYYDELQSQFGKDRFTKEQIAPDVVLGGIQAYDGLDERQATYEFYRRSLDRTPLYYKYEDQYELDKYNMDRAVKQSQMARNRSAIQADQSNIRLNNAQMNALMRSPMDVVKEVAANIVLDENSTEKLIKGGDPALRISKGQYGDEVTTPFLRSTGFVEQDKDGRFTLKPNAKIVLATPGLNKSLKNVPQHLVGQPVTVNGLVSKVERDKNGEIDLKASKVYVSVNIPVGEGYRPPGSSNFDKSGTKSFLGGSTVTGYRKVVNDWTANPLRMGKNDRWALEGALIPVNPGLIQQLLMQQEMGNLNVGDSFMGNSFPGAQGPPRPKSPWE